MRVSSVSKRGGLVVAASLVLLVAGGAFWVLRNARGVEPPRGTKPFAPAPARPAPLDDGEARDPITRATLTRRETPPFGPEVLPLADERAVLEAERRYYEAHPAEYDRFVARFGDVHGLR